MTNKKPVKGKPKSKTAVKANAKTSARIKANNTKMTAPNLHVAQEENKLIERKGISLWDPAAVISTVFSFGRIPYAPGTWGSLFAVAVFNVFIVPVFFVYLKTENKVLFFGFIAAFLVLLYCIGLMAIRSYHSKTRVADAPEIVYDEFFAQILTYVISFSVYFYLVPNPQIEPFTNTHALIFQLTPFLFFRLFDICKPWPINKIDAADNSAKGVMFDDVIAAFYASTASIVVFLVMSNYIW